MLNNKNEYDPYYFDRLIHKAKQEAVKLHPNVVWEFEKLQNVKDSSHDIYISAKRQGGTILVRFRVEPKQLSDKESLRILLNKMAGFL